jgi:hypothetical protein
MPKPKTVRFTEEWLSKLPPAPAEGPAEGELVTCPACLDQHPLIYEDEQPTPSSWGYVEYDWEYVLAVVEGRVLGDSAPEVDEH